MRIYRTEETLSKDGTLHLESLPFQKGECVEITVQSRSDEGRKAAPPSLAGKVRRYDRPIESVAEDDWDVLQ